MNGTARTLETGKLSDWITLTFRAAPRIKVSGICRMLVTEMGEHFSLYVTPINIDPEKPAMPISHPSYYATYLAKRDRPVLDARPRGGHLGAQRGRHRRRHVPAADLRHRRASASGCSSPALDKLRQGSLVCVFDATDRIQHMFWRYLDHGASGRARARGTPQHRDAIEKLYRHNDELVGKVMARLRDGRRADGGVRPRLQLVPPRRQSTLAASRTAISRSSRAQTARAEWLRDVDWSQTRAYASA